MQNSVRSIHSVRSGFFLLFLNGLSLMLVRTLARTLAAVWAS
jgi:hypothetical protein